MSTHNNISICDTGDTETTLLLSQNTRTMGHTISICDHKDHTIYKTLLLDKENFKIDFESMRLKMMDCKKIIFFAMKLLRKQRNIPVTHNILTTVFVS